MDAEHIICNDMRLFRWQEKYLQTSVHLHSCFSVRHWDGLQFEVSFARFNLKVTEFGPCNKALKEHHRKFAVAWCIVLDSLQAWKQRSTDAGNSSHVLCRRRSAYWTSFNILYLVVDKWGDNVALESQKYLRSGRRETHASKLPMCRWTLHTDVPVLWWQIFCSSLFL